MYLKRNKAFLRDKQGAIAPVIYWRFKQTFSQLIQMIHHVYTIYWACLRKKIEFEWLKCDEFSTQVK